MNATNGTKIDLDTCERRRLAMNAGRDLIRQGYSAAEALAVVWNDRHVRAELIQWAKDWNESR